MFYVRIGDPTTEAGRAQLERQSPLHSVNEIKAPLLIVQGANDPRVKQAQTDELVAALRGHGDEVTYLIAKDEGHVMGNGEGFAQPINNSRRDRRGRAILRDPGRYPLSRRDATRGGAEAERTDRSSLASRAMLTLPARCSDRG